MSGLAPRLRAQVKAKLRQSENWTCVPIQNRDSTSWLETEAPSKAKHEAQDSGEARLQNDGSLISAMEDNFTSNRNNLTGTRWAAHGSVKIIATSHGLSKTKAQ